MTTADPALSTRAHRSGAGTARVRWADAAKGLCIAAVVLHHVVGKHLPALAGTVPWVEAAWSGLDAALDPVRMPLFFLISGTFAASAVARPWSRSWRDRLLRPYWVYLMWLPVHALVFTVVATRIETHRVADVAGLAGNLVFASTGLWYLFGLAAYFALVKATASLPTPAVVTVAGLVSLVSSWLPLDGVNELSLVRCLVFFVIGARMPDLLGRLGRLRRREVALAAGCYVACGTAVVALHPPKSVTTLLLAPAAVTLGVGAARVVDRSRAGAWASRLGRATLPVYVMHMPLLGLVHQAVTSAPVSAEVSALAAAAGPAGWTAVVVVYPLALGWALVTVPLRLQRVLARVGCRFLLEPPSRLAA